MVQIFEEFKEYIVNGTIALIGGIIGYFANKRKDTAEVEVTETDVIKSIRELYTGLVDDMKTTVEELKDTKKQLHDLSAEIDTLRDNVSVLEKDLEDCRKGITDGNNRTKKG